MQMQDQDNVIYLREQNIKKFPDQVWRINQSDFSSESFQNQDILTSTQTFWQNQVSDYKESLTRPKIYEEDKNYRQKAIKLPPKTLIAMQVLQNEERTLQRYQTQIKNKKSHRLQSHDKAKVHLQQILKKQSNLTNKKTFRPVFLRKDRYLPKLQKLNKKQVFKQQAKQVKNPEFQQIDLRKNQSFKIPGRKQRMLKKLGVQGILDNIDLRYSQNFENRDEKLYQKDKPQFLMKKEYLRSKIQQDQQIMRKQREYYEIIHVPVLHNALICTLLNQRAQEVNYFIIAKNRVTGKVDIYAQKHNGQKEQVFFDNFKKVKAYLKLLHLQIESIQNQYTRDIYECLIKMLQQSDKKIKTFKYYKSSLRLQDQQELYINQDSEFYLPKIINLKNMKFKGQKRHNLRKLNYSVI